jgi:hypothetical protein
MSILKRNVLIAQELFRQMKEGNLETEEDNKILSTGDARFTLPL